jgi:hypothetical protein
MAQEVSKYLVIGAVVLLIAAVAAVWWYIGDPKWVVGVVSASIGAAFTAALPFVIKMLKPKDLTPIQKELIRQGLDPHQNPRQHEEKH